MQYELSNGVKINLYNNTDIAKFVYLKLPTLGVSFVGEVPHLTSTPAVKKIHEIAQRLAMRRAFTRRKRIEEIRNKVTNPADALYDECFRDEYDDDIPPF